MKSILPILAISLCFTLSVKAQQIDGLSKGDFIIEGNLTYNNVDNKDTEIKNTRFNFSPKVGAFVSDRVALGISLSIGSTSRENYTSNPTTKVNSNSFGFGGFGRYYFLELGDRFKTYSELAVGYHSSVVKEIAGNNVIEQPSINGIGINAGLGAHYFLTNSLAINFAFANVIGYNSSRIDRDGDRAKNAFDININNFNNFFNSAEFGLTFRF